MSNEVMYKKLAAVSFTDVYEQIPEMVVVPRAAAGRLYANIHRTSTMMPHSLRIDEANHSETALPESKEIFVIPKMR